MCNTAIGSPPYSFYSVPPQQFFQSFGFYYKIPGAMQSLERASFSEVVFSTPSSVSVPVKEVKVLAKDGTVLFVSFIFQKTLSDHQIKTEVAHDGTEYCSSFNQFSKNTVFLLRAYFFDELSFKTNLDFFVSNFPPTVLLELMHCSSLINDTHLRNLAFEALRKQCHTYSYRFLEEMSLAFCACATHINSSGDFWLSIKKRMKGIPYPPQFHLWNILTNPEWNALLRNKVCEALQQKPNMNSNYISPLMIAPVSFYEYFGTRTFAGAFLTSAFESTLLCFTYQFESKEIRLVTNLCLRHLCKIRFLHLINPSSVKKEEQFISALELFTLGSVVQEMGLKSRALGLMNKQECLFEHTALIASIGCMQGYAPSRMTKECKEELEKSSQLRHPLEGLSYIDWAFLFKKFPLEIPIYNYFEEPDSSPFVRAVINTSRHDGRDPVIRLLRVFQPESGASPLLPLAGVIAYAIGAFLNYDQSSLGDCLREKLRLQSFFIQDGLRTFQQLTFEEWINIIDRYRKIEIVPSLYRYLLNQPIFRTFLEAIVFTETPMFVFDIPTSEERSVYAELVLRNCIPKMSLVKPHFV